jgi:hypothetical protein
MYEYRDPLAIAKSQRIESTFIPNLLPWWEVVKKGFLGGTGCRIIELEKVGNNQLDLNKMLKLKRSRYNRGKVKKVSVWIYSENI